MHCNRCGSVNYCKSGYARGRQRYKCRDCGRHFTNAHGLGHPPIKQVQALQLYAENMGIRSISRHLGVSPATVVLWVRDRGQKLIEQLRQSIPKKVDSMDIIEIDEMWHYCQKNSENYGYGLLYLATQDGSSPLRLALVAPKRLSDCGVESDT